MDPSAVKTLAQTTVNSLGQPIAWPQGGTPEVTALLVEMAPGEELPWHKHPVPLLGYIFSGELTVYQITGEKRTVRAGEVSLESVGVVHRGVNEGSEPCRMIVFVLGRQGEPFTEDVPSA
ncbi:MAG TPA: cupin domain-containing protein [Candidatus Methylacidiphilales bacterium]|jgi:quercetin dioxygenase-like cupin family protein|nr:cupin domain-containing protein [Candidatus Methylacidiphilales bacterium]